MGGGLGVVDVGYYDFLCIVVYYLCGVVMFVIWYLYDRCDVGVLCCDVDLYGGVDIYGVVFYVDEELVEVGCFHGFVDVYCLGLVQVDVDGECFVVQFV